MNIEAALAVLRAEETTDDERRATLQDLDAYLFETLILAEYHEDKVSVLAEALCLFTRRLQHNAMTADQVEPFLKKELKHRVSDYKREVSRTIQAPRSTNSSRRKRGQVEHEPLIGVGEHYQDIGVPDATALVQDEAGESYLPSRLVQDGNLDDLREALVQTEDEKLVFGSWAEGRSRREIVAHAGLSEGTVKTILNRFKERAARYQQRYAA